MKRRSVSRAAPRRRRGPGGMGDRGGEKRIDHPAAHAPHQAVSEQTRALVDAVFKLYENPQQRISLAAALLNLHVLVVKPRRGGVRFFLKTPSGQPVIEVR